MPGTTGSRALPALLQDRYRLGGIIGRGGASTVLRARDELLGRDVAVKVFTARATGPADLRAQEAEARMLAAMHHHALVTLLDAGIDLTDAAAPQVYLVLELIEDADLRAQLRSGPLSAFDVAYLGYDLAGALDYVHEHGVVHRDVKPANVLLSGVGTNRIRGKLADFGIALLRASAERPEEQTTGTAAYLSPEQVSGDPLTPATDVYSLALVLLEALTGRPAYTGTILETALARLEREPFIPPSVPAGVATVLRAMTASRPDDRPTPKEVELAFQRYIVDTLAAGREAKPAVSEAERLAVLRRYDLLDTPPDGAFDRITAVAARTTDMPIAFVGLADEHRLWLKSRIGMPVAELPLPLAGATAPDGLLPRTVVVQRPEQLPDLAREHGIRAFAATPLKTGEGVVLGMLAVADERPRDLAPEDLSTLEDLAALVVHEMELRLAVRRAVQLRGPAA